jgi:hypothetical protein
MVTAFPTFKGSRVDLCRQEFRTESEAMPFLSPKGMKLLAELEAFAQDVVEFYAYM